jgi:hypothetical protein
MFMVYHYDMDKFMYSLGKWRYHNHIDSNFGDSDGPDFEQYKAVALVDVPELHQVFQATNHIDSNWTENAEVVALPNGKGQRSTSVGDIVVDLSTNTSYICASFGWDEIIVEHRPCEDRFRPTVEEVTT